jgi:hypothetical protein
MRRKLPDRRRSETWTATLFGREFSFTVGFYGDGTPGEVFVDTDKPGSAVARWANESAMLVSLALQHGVELSEVSRLLRNRDLAEVDVRGGHPMVRKCSSELDYAVRVMEVEYAHQRTPSSGVQPTAEPPQPSSPPPRQDPPHGES